MLGRQGRIAFSELLLVSKACEPWQHACHLSGGSADYAVAALGAEAEACIRAAAEQLFREADAAPARGGIDYGNGLLLACSQMPPKQRTGLQARVYPNPAGGIPLQDSGELYQQAVQFEGIVAEQPQLKAPPLAPTGYLLPEQGHCPAVLLRRTAGPDGREERLVCLPSCSCGRQCLAACGACC